MAIGEVIMSGLLCAVLGAIMLVGGTGWIEHRGGHAPEVDTRRLLILLAGVGVLGCVAMMGALYWAFGESRTLVELRLLGITIGFLGMATLMGGLYWVTHRV